VLLIFAGLAVVLGAVVAGYLMEQGNLWVLMQPAELLIIGGEQSASFWCIRSAQTGNAVGLKDLAVVRRLYVRFHFELSRCRARH
jgi:flagellar motor component MotA